LTSAGLRGERSEHCQGLFLSDLVPESCQKRSYLSKYCTLLVGGLGVCDPGGVNQRIRLPSLIRLRQPVHPTHHSPFLSPPISSSVLRQCTLISFLPFSPCHGERLNSLHPACTLTLLNIGDVKHTVLQIRLRRSLHRDTLIASRREVSMGAHLYRCTRRRHTATYAYPKTAFETDISS
jgi:hypothetical protein